MEKEYKETLTLLNTTKQLILTRAKVASECLELEAHAEYVAQFKALDEISRTLQNNKNSWMISKLVGDANLIKMYAEQLLRNMNIVKNWITEEYSNN